MKASKQCPKCHSLRVGYLEHLWHQDAGQGSTGPKEMPVGVVEEQGIFFTYKSVVGGLEAFLCTECGFFETYIKSPEDVPFDELVGFSWLNPEAPESGPFR